MGVEDPDISIIIPTIRTEDKLQPLLGDIRLQSVDSIEVILAYKFSPSGKARNAGAALAKGKYLVFMDDDIGLGNEKVVFNLCEVLKSDSAIGLAGASTLIPPDANKFQKRVSVEVPRMTFPVVDEIVESDMVTTQCWAQRRENFEKAGPFTEIIERGVDPEYRYRVRSLGYKIVIAPQTWTFHPPPDNFKSFIKQTYRNGRASARAQKYHPELVVPVPDSGEGAATKDVGFIWRLLRSAWKLTDGIIRLRFLQVCERIIYGLGYLAGRMIKI